MKRQMAFQVAATYVGAVMGAGFASGQEIQQFFTRFGPWGLGGIIISAGLFCLLGWAILDLLRRWQISSYPELFQHLLGLNWGRRADVLVSILLFVGMIAMLSASGALFQEYFGFSRWLGISLTLIVIGLALWFRGEGVLWINTVLIPLKFTFCLGIALVAIFLGGAGDGEGLPVLTNPVLNHWVLSGILYVSFNLTLAMVVFASLGQQVQTAGARLGAVLGGAALGAFALVIGASLLRFQEVIGLEIPMVGVAGKLGDWPAFLYVVVLWLAMVTAAIGDGFSLISRVVSNGRFAYGRTTIGLLALVFPLAGVKFSQIVQIGYPVFGYLGFFFLPAILYAWLRR